MIINAEGIVLRQRKIANNRRMIVLFTKQYGKLSAGTSVNEKSRSKAALALRPFTYAEYDIFKGRDAYSINSAQVNKSFYSIGEDIDRFINASAFIEYLDKVLEEGVPAPKLFDLSLEFLQSVSECRSGTDTLLYAFIVKTFRMLGVAPELGCCVNCGKAPEKFGGGFKIFSVTDGGIICPDCTDGLFRSIILIFFYSVLEVSSASGAEASLSSTDSAAAAPFALLLPTRIRMTDIPAITSPRTIETGVLVPGM